MGSYDLLFEASFLRDYEGAAGYLSNQLHSPQAARNLVAQVRKAADLLQDMPLVHAVSRRPVLAQANLREHFLDSYVIIYHFDEITVRFVRLFHQSQQYDDEWYWGE